jgi:hypothetical protein
MTMRRLVHPGPVAAERHHAVACAAVPVSIRLRAGASVNEAVALGLAERGFRAGHVSLRDVALAPIAYVIPAPAPDENHVAWYSETHLLETGTVTQAGCTVGLRDGEPFLHCHGLWRGGGEARMGHLLPLEARLARDAVVEGWGIDGAVMVARDDPETGFRLFRAEPAEKAGAAGARRAVLASIRPNRDIGEALAAIAGEHGLARCEVLGIGSLTGCRFADGRVVDWHANEALILDGMVEAGAARLDMAVVDRDGRIETGRLEAGSNAVSVTFEALLIEAEGTR